MPRDFEQYAGGYRHSSALVGFAAGAGCRHRRCRHLARPAERGAIFSSLGGCQCRALLPELRVGPSGLGMAGIPWWDPPSARSHRKDRQACQEAGRLSIRCYPGPPQGGAQGRDNRVDKARGIADRPLTAPDQLGETRFRHIRSVDLRLQIWPVNKYAAHAHRVHHRPSGRSSNALPFNAGRYRVNRGDLMALICTLSGHVRDKNRAWYDGLDWRSSCKRCGAPMIKDSLSGHWRLYVSSDDSNQRSEKPDHS